MTKKILIAAMLAAVTTVPVFAATTGDTEAKPEWLAKMNTHHQEMIQQAVDSGRITAEQAVQMNEHMKEMEPLMQQMMKNEMKSDHMGNDSRMNHNSMMGAP